MKKASLLVAGAALGLVGSVIGIGAAFNYAAKNTRDPQPTTLSLEEQLKERSTILLDCFDERNKHPQKLLATRYFDYEVPSVGGENFAPNTATAELSQDGKVTAEKLWYTRVEEEFNGGPAVWTDMRGISTIVYTPGAGIDYASDIIEVRQPNGEWKRAEDISSEGKIEAVLSTQPPAFRKYEKDNDGLMVYAYKFFLRPVQESLGCELPHPAYGSKKPGVK